MWSNINKIFPSVFLLCLLAAVWFAYGPGLSGGFLFDDYPNLEPLGFYGGVVDWETFKSFTLSGISGPLGRPISLASFVIDDNTWPSQGAWFKSTNIKIHLLNGLLLIWVTILLLRVLKRDESRVVWIALISGAIWLLHPYMVSTTLYVIQRMALLSAFFMLAGMLGYFHGRLLLERGEVVLGYVWMTLSLCVGTVFAVFSKENGVLLPVLLAAVESCLPANAQRLRFWWKAIFLWGPSIIIALYLLQKLNLSSEPMSGRRFTQLERIMTQPRVLWEYLYHLYVPRIEGRGLFQDGYKFSTSLLSPVTTLLSIIALFFLWYGAFKYRKRLPLLAISISFFFVSHLLESTWLNLELYFEHRNYIATIFLFLPLAAGLVCLVKYVDIKLVSLCIFCTLFLLGFLTWQRSQLWSDSDRLELYWAASTPESARAQNRVATLLLQEGKVNESIQFLQAADDRFETSSLLTINLLLVKVYAEVASEKDFNVAAARIKSQPFDAQSVKGLRNLIEWIVSLSEKPEYVTYALTLMDAIHMNDNYARSSIYIRLHSYLKGMLFLKSKDYISALNSYEQAMDLFSETDAALSIVADVANAGRPSDALLLLQKAKKIYEGQEGASLQRSREVYDAEFERMEYILTSAIRSLPAQYREGNDE